jgi:DNA-directed RNA polymerase specialized sigma subunit
MAASTVAMYDILMDGDWHQAGTLQLEGALALISADFETAVKLGQKSRKNADLAPYEYALSGGNDQARNNLMIGERSGRLIRKGTMWRMYADSCRAWHEASQGHEHDLTDVPDGHDPDKIRTFAGITETRAFEAVPVQLKDRVIFRTNFEIPPATWAIGMSLSWHMSQDSNTGLYRIDGPARHGKIIEAYVRDWCEEAGIIPTDMRVIERVKNRDLTRLPPGFLDGLVRFYQPFLTRRMRKAMTTIQTHIHDRDDQAQQFAEWVLSAVREYDESKSVPFGAYLIGRTHNKVHDLTRERLGRTNADHQNRVRKIIGEFVQAEGRAPTNNEIADLMGKTPDEYANISQTLDTAAKVHGPTSIQGIWEDNQEIQIAAAFDVTENVLSDVDAAAATAAVVGACMFGEEDPNLVALGHMYMHYWSGLPKSQTADLMGVSTQVVSSATERVMPAVERALACL